MQQQAYDEIKTEKDAETAKITGIERQFPSKTSKHDLRAAFLSRIHNGTAIDNCVRKEKEK